MKKLQSQNNKIFNFILKSTLLLTLVLTGVKCNFECSASAVVSQPTTASTTPPSANQPAEATSKTPTTVVNQTMPTGFKKAESFDFKSALVKFALAMFGVLVSALTIFLGLKVYTKMSAKSGGGIGNSDFENSLESPKDFKEAINLFLHKSDK